jgi:hypothetical protein
MSDTPLPSLLCRSAVIVGREGARAPHAGRESRGVVRAAAAPPRRLPSRAETVARVIPLVNRRSVARSWRGELGERAAAVHPARSVDTTQLVVSEM